MFQILEPLEVRDRDTSAVAEHVREEADASPQENILSRPRGGPVSSLDDQLATVSFRIVFVDRLLEGCRDEEVAE